MAASYPSAVRSFSTKTNVLDIIDASDPNSLQEEVIAIETSLGINPALSTTPNPSSGFTATSTQYSTLAQRLANIENGIVGDSHTQYLKKAGGETITNATASNVAIIVKGASSQSANLQEWKNSSNTTVASLTVNGTFTANSVSTPELDLLSILSIFGV
jgi:hypothetical protein